MDASNENISGSAIKDIIDVYASFVTDDNTFEDVTILGIHKLKDQVVVEIEYELHVIYIHVSVGISPYEFFGNITARGMIIHTYIHKDISSFDVDELLKVFPNVDTLEVLCDEPEDFFIMHNPAIYSNLKTLACGVVTPKLAKTINRLTKLDCICTKTLTGDFELASNIQRITVMEETPNVPKYFGTCYRIGARYMKNGKYQEVTQPKSLFMAANTIINKNRFVRTALPGRFQ